ncbi:MAG: hypothetical protein D6734_11160 [Candidatus Schekmanbacteria bacterium]|nr:MAG: hypothetical protein D6734_11160 [Candidatus Schekmanbacteria bacterium]
MMRILFYSRRNIMAMRNYMKYFRGKSFLLILSLFYLFVFGSCSFFAADHLIIKKYTSTSQEKVNEEGNSMEVVQLTEPVVDSNKEWYTVGPEDIINIKVWEHNELSFEAEVLEDGTINYPFFKKIYVAGLTPSEIADKIAGLLSNGYIENPQVFVSVKEYRSKKVFVIGEAEKNGKYFLKKPTSLFEFISQLGGLKKTAGNRIIIKRLQKDNNSEKMVEIEIPVIDGEIQKNILLQENDVIDIPEAKFFISGEVGKSGYYTLQEDYNIYQAIIVAGDFTRGARETAVKLIRNGGREVYVVNVERIRKGLERGLPAKSERFRKELEELKIRDGDVIIVPKSIFYSE